jgi:hypothetical protein
VGSVVTQGITAMALGWRNDGDGTRCFSGQIGEVIISAVAMTAAQVYAESLDLAADGSYGITI